MSDNFEKSVLRMPAEWEPHKAVWLAWPYDLITFGSLNQKDEKLDEGRIKRVEEAFNKIISALEGSEEVKLITKNQADYADVWTRDYMPTFVKDQNGKVSAVKWIYNAYGEKFGELLRDNNVWKEVNKNSEIETIETNLIMESGAIDVNGQGALLTTEQCLLTRNGDMSKEEIENKFKEYLGVSKVIWLKSGLMNDHTDGHIDEIARFVSSNKIVCAYEDDTKEENFRTLDENYTELKKATDTSGKSFEIIKLPMPHMIYDDGKKAPVSYANFYVSNKVVLVSTFNDVNDAKAIEIIQSCFPNRKVIGIDCSDIIYGGGAIHCITQQEPL
jgi:agmatine deiminase